MRHMTGPSRMEFCIWALSCPLSREDAIAGLSRRLPGFRRHLTEGRIELVDGYVVPSERPGLGITLRRDVVRAISV